MQLPKRDRHSPLWSGALVVVILGASAGLFAQSATSEVVANPIEIKGNAQAGVVGLTPAQVRHAYGFDQLTNQGAGQTIAVIEAFGDQSIEKDLGKFSDTFGLPPCTMSNGCLQILTTNGKNLGNGPGNSKVNPNHIWLLETALDVEWAHAIAPDASIMLVETPSDSLTDLLSGVDFAVRHNATVVSMSWGGLEFVGENALDSHFQASGVSFVASSGDSGSLLGPLYPAASPNVLAVGGTTLTISDSLGTYGKEVAWSSSGGGLSIGEGEPMYQIPFEPAGVRGNPDVAYDADPNTGFAVYTTTSTPYGNGWLQIAGTSAGAPQWSALIAIAKSQGWSPAPKTGTNTAIYNAASQSYGQNFHDVTLGSNGAFNAGVGYDFVTGIGSPQAQNLVNALLSAH